MNEITNIHLGRQSFTIAVDAHKLLRAYLSAIEKQVGDNAQDVVEEVELRMAELLTERGISGDKVVLIQDVSFLKQQLGEPRDFKEEDDDTAAATDDSIAPGHKRLFRDADNGMLAGVAAGLSAYSGVPVLIIRLVFIGLAFASGVGILIYVLLWLLLPETKSPSDYLQMKGLAVTIDNLKTVVDRADFQGAAERAGHVMGRTWCRLTRLVSGIIGVGFLLISVASLAVAATATSYLLVHGLQLAGAVLFPVGSREVTAVICGLAALVLIAFMLALTGRAMLIRKWTVPTWAVAAVIASFVIVTSVGTALGFAVAPTVHHRYMQFQTQLQHTEIRALPSFQNVDVRGGPSYVMYQSDPHYSLEIRYLGTVNSKTITTKVVGDTLEIDTSSYHSSDQASSCFLFCPFGRDNIELIVHQPSPDVPPPLLTPIKPTPPVPLKP